jgi:adenylate cyclase
MTPEEFAAAGVFDPDLDAGTGRLELLQWLDAQGFTLDDIIAAHGRIGLGALASDRRLLPGERLSDEEAREVSGLDPETHDAIALAFGFVSWDDDTGLGLTAAEARMIGLFGSIAEMFSDEEGLGFVRVLGSAFGRISDAAVSLFLTDVEGPHLAAAGNELELAEKVYEAVGLLDELVLVFDPVLRRHVLQAVERGRHAVIDPVERLQYRYAVGFVDLVGFTPISRDMSPAELASFIRRFEGRAHDAVTTGGGRLVKLIGDEVMFVAPDANSACRVAQALLEAVATEGSGDVLPRAGLAYGDVLVRGGDYYGDVVNMASRLVDEAVPQELLVSEAFADAADHLAFEPAGRRMLKGFPEPVVVRSILVTEDQF